MIKGNLAEIQPKNDLNVQKMHFLQKVLGIDGLRWLKTVSSTFQDLEFDGSL